VFLAAFVWILYHPVTRLWWMDDDLFHLHFLSMHSALEYCFSPRVCRLMSDNLFTPLPYVSYSLDLALFGRSPAAFHAHQLLALFVAAAALYAAFRRWLSPSLSGFAASFFVLGIPSAFWVLDLMLRHYLEGLIWAALALIGFVEAIRRTRPGLSILSSVFYFAAMSEKEIYVPLFVFLLFLPEGSWRGRLRLLRWHVVALLMYLGWRWVMLGTLLGGSGWAIRPRELPRLIATLPVRIGDKIFSGPPAFIAILLGCVLAGATWLAWRRRGTLNVVALSAILILGPLIPAAQSTDERFGTLPWLLICVLFVFGCQDLLATSFRARRAAVLLLLVGFSAAFICNRADWRKKYAWATQMSTEGRFFLSMLPSDLLRHPRIPPGAMNETRWFKEESLGLPKGSGWFADDVYLCGAASPAARVWEYDATQARVREVTAEVRSAAIRYCSSLRLSAPLRAEFESLGNVVFWHLGPYSEGRYSFVLRKGIESFAVPAEAGYQALPKNLSLMVRYASPAGWITFSPELTMDFQSTARFRWERP
jgi:hypothetical protein